VPRTYRVIIFDQAFSDIDHIVEYVSTDSPQNAANVIGMLLNAIHSLTEFPHRFAVLEARRDPALAVRSMPVSSFVVYYRIDDRLGVVRVLGVSHGSRRRPRRFRP
jgi:toxin ParE1/3/4